MISRLQNMFGGSGTKARALRGTIMTALQVGGGNALRLVSNLILTRLLFPEAFGLMALVQIFVYGLQTFSDVGINTMLIQNKRDDPVFVNTLWTMQIIRGVLLWGGACALALPAAWLYDQPQLTGLLPIAAFSMVILGFRTTREAQAKRVLKLERVITLELSAQLVGLVCMALLAWWLQSVWALAIGTVVNACITVAVMHVFLPGAPNRLCWDWQVVKNSLGFGSFLLLSSTAGFFHNMGAQMVLGVYVPVGLLGLYHIAKQLSALPGTLAMTVSRNVIFPLYRMSPPTESAQNQANVFRARRLVSLFAISITTFVALTGDWIVIILFDPNYELAGPMLVLMALAALPAQGYIGIYESLSASGDSKRQFYLSFVKAAMQMSLLLLLVPIAGVPMAILAPAIASLFIYPYQAVLTNRYKAWDAIGEISLILFGLGLAALIAWLKWEALKPLFISQ